MKAKPKTRTPVAAATKPKPGRKAHRLGPKEKAALARAGTAAAKSQRQGAVQAVGVDAAAAGQGSARTDFASTKPVDLLLFGTSLRDGLTDNPYYPTLTVELGQVGKAVFNLNADLTLINTLDQQLKAARAGLEIRAQEAREIYRTTAKACEVVNSSDEALVSAGWQLRRSPGPSQTMGMPQGLKVRGTTYSGVLRATWRCEKNCRVYELQCASSAEQPNPVIWDGVPILTSMRSKLVLTEHPVGHFLMVRVRALGAKGPGPWCDPISARVV